MKTRMLWCAAALLTTVGVGLANAQTKDPWIGKRVFTQFGTVLKVGNQVVDDEGRTTSLTVSGHDRNKSRVYRVEHVNGEWLWLQDEKSGVSGWVQSRFVIPYEQAIDYFTNQIRANPKAYLYNSRGLVWDEKGEYDIAIADYNEAIRLEPSEASYFSNRGLAWDAKKDYEKAIADYNEAIRLDPKYAMAYHNRGTVWYAKKDYEKAIADYNEAIRLDSKNAMAYYGRGIAWSNKKEYDKAIADYTETIRLDPKYANAYNARAWLWAVCPNEKYRDGKRAVESATRACELSEWKEAYYLGTLAAAYAESGEFDKAGEWQVKANTLYTDAEVRKKGEDRLKLYKDKKPYREEP